MKTLNILLLALALQVLATGPAQSQGTLLAGHFGANDPFSEGFTVVTFGSPQVGSVTNDLGIDAWSTRVSEAAVVYSRSLPHLAGFDWALSITMRVVSPNVNPAISLISTVDSGTDRFRMSFGSDSNGDPLVIASGLNSSGIIVLTGAGLSYHNYTLLYQAATDTAALWIDGSESVSDITGSSSSLPPQMTWSGASRSATDLQANWSEASLTIIPEPSSLTLFLTGGILAANGFIRRRRSLRCASNRNHTCA